MTQRPLPTGTLTFLFTDIEGSTRLAERSGVTSRERCGFAPECLSRTVAARRHAPAG